MANEKKILPGFAGEQPDAVDHTNPPVPNKPITTDHKPDHSFQRAKVEPVPPPVAKTEPAAKVVTEKK